MENQLHTKELKNIKSTFFVLILAVFMDLLGFSIVIPFLPFWVLSLGAPDYVYGIFLAIFSFFQFILSPVWGKLSDKYGRRPIILTGLVGSFISFSILFISCVFFNNLEMILLSEIVGGIFTAATLPTGYAYISDAVKPEDQSHGYSLIALAMGLAMVFGPALGGFLTTVGKIVNPSTPGYWAPILLTVIFSLINLVLGIVNLPESLSEETKVFNRSKKHVTTHRFEAAHIARENPRIFIVIILFSIYTFTFSAFEAFLPLYGKERMQLDEFSTGLIFAFFGIVMIVVQGGLVRRLAGKYQRTVLIIAGYVLMTSGFFLALFTDSFITLLAINVPLGFGVSIAQPSFNAQLALEMPKGKRGEILGFAESFKAGSRIIGPIIGTALLAINIFYPWVFNGLVLFFGLCLSIYLGLSYKKVDRIRTQKRMEIPSL